MYSHADSLALRMLLGHHIGEYVFGSVFFLSSKNFKMEDRAGTYAQQCWYAGRFGDFPAWRKCATRPENVASDRMDSCCSPPAETEETHMGQQTANLFLSAVAGQAAGQDEERVWQHSTDDCTNETPCAVALSACDWRIYTIRPGGRVAEGAARALMRIIRTNAYNIRRRLYEWEKPCHCPEDLWACSHFAHDAEGAVGNLG